MSRPSPTPKEICIEDLDLAPEDERYLRCVALPDLEPGLALDREGAVRWMPDVDEDEEHEVVTACGLWVSADDQLMLLRTGTGTGVGGDGDGPLIVERSGRAIEAPANKPVVLLDQDLLRLGGRRLRVHVHGDAEEIYPPEPVTASAIARLARTAATALSLGAASLAGGPADAANPAGPAGQDLSNQGPTIEVRARPPAPPPRRVLVICDVTAITEDKKTKPKARFTVVARCPAGKTLRVGTRGELLDPKTKHPVPRGSVMVDKVEGRRVSCRSRLKEKVSVKQVRFYTH